MNTLKKVSVVVALGVLTLGSAAAVAEGRRALLPQIGAATHQVAAFTAGIGELSAELGAIVAQIGVVTAEIGARLAADVATEFRSRSEAPRIATSRGPSATVTVSELIDSVVVEASRLPADPNEDTRVIRTARVQF